MLGDPEGRRRTATPAAKTVKGGKTLRRGKGLRLVTIRQQAKSSYRRLWVGGAALVLLLFIGWWLFWPASQDKDAALPPGAVRAPSGEIVQSPAPGIVAATVPEAAPLETKAPLIKSVRLLPSQPTRQDTLKVEIIPHADAPSGLTYRYEWRVNDGVVTGAAEDFLKLADLKKKDRVSVTVTPNGVEGRGFPVTSPEVVVYGIAPTLDLELKRPAGQGERPSELQLVTVAPDSTQLTFSLEPPLVKGMTIDKSTGRISWSRPADLKEVFTFGAAVEDESGTKVNRTFEVTLR